MIILDTNVLSETLRPRPELAVMTWLGSHPMTSLFTSTITQAEILYGIALLIGGQRRDALETAAQAMFAEGFAGRILPFDEDAASAYAEIAADRRRRGAPIGQLDAQIAAIARSRGATLATRNIRDFEGCGLDLFDPWTAG